MEHDGASYCYNFRMSRTASAAGKRVTVSLPEDLAETVEEVAAHEDRSVSGQIVNIVRQWAERRRQSVVVTDREFDALIQEVRQAPKRTQGWVPPTLERLIQRSHGG